MKRISAGALLLALAAAPAAFPAGLNVTSAGVETDFSSKYTRRGMAYSTGPVAQPYGWITVNDFTVSLWGNAVLTDEPANSIRAGAFDGGDVAASWSHDFGRWRIEPGFEFWFDRPVNGVFDPATGEWSARISWGIGPVRLFVNQAFDTIRFRGAYYGEAGPQFTASRKGFDFEGSLRGAWASAKFNRVYAGVSESEPTFIGADGSVTYHFPRGVYLRAHSEVTRMTDAAIRRSLNQQTLFSAGLALGYEWTK